MDEFLDRLRRTRSRVGLGDRTTAIAAASIVMVLALIGVAFQSSSSGDETREAGETSSETAFGIEDVPDLNREAPSAESGGTGTRGTGHVAASEDASAGVPAAEVPPKGVAITQSAVKIGISYNKDPGTANAAAGFSGVGQVDQRRGWDAVVREINKNPPFGRKVIPVYYAVTTDDITSKGDERLQQEACAKFTQDDRVFMVWEWTVGGDILSACLTKAGIPEIGARAADSSAFKKFPYLVMPSQATMDRMAEFEVDQLFEVGYFSGFKENTAPYTPQKPPDGKPRIGLIRYNEPEYAVAAAAMKRRLAAHGLSLCDGCEFEVAYSSDNVPEMLDDATEVNAAIQSFKSKGVTHVMFLGTTNGVRITLFFIDGAEKQAYRPRLGFNPNDVPTAVRDFLGEPSYPQFRESLLVTDGPSQFDVRTPAFKACKKIFEDAGETFTGDEASNKENQIPSYCDAAWYTHAAMRSAGETLNLKSWMTAVQTMDAVSSASVYRMQTKRGRPDGSGAVRVGAWYEDCDCFKPITGIVPV